MHVSRRSVVLSCVAAVRVYPGRVALPARTAMTAGDVLFQPTHLHPTANSGQTPFPPRPEEATTDARGKAGWMQRTRGLDAEFIDARGRWSAVRFRHAD